MGVLLFLDVSGGELLVVLLFVLLFFGSRGVPEVARTMGRAMRQLRDATADVQREIEKGANEVKKGYEQQKQVFRIEPPEHVTKKGTAGPLSGDPAKESGISEAPSEAPVPPAPPTPNAVTPDPRPSTSTDPGSPSTTSA